jgi:hypothetical protein
MARAPLAALARAPALARGARRGSRPPTRQRAAGPLPCRAGGSGGGEPASWRREAAEGSSGASSGGGGDASSSGGGGGSPEPGAPAPGLAGAAAGGQPAGAWPARLARAAAHGAAALTLFVAAAALQARPAAAAPSPADLGRALSGGEASTSGAGEQQQQQQQRQQRWGVAAWRGANPLGELAAEARGGGAVAEKLPPPKDLERMIRWAARGRRRPRAGVGRTGCGGVTSAGTAQRPAGSGARLPCGPQPAVGPLPHAHHPTRSAVTTQLTLPSPRRPPGPTPTCARSSPARRRSTTGACASRSAATRRVSAASAAAGPLGVQQRQRAEKDPAVAVFFLSCTRLCRARRAHSSPLPRRSHPHHPQAYEAAVSSRLGVPLDFEDLMTSFVYAPQDVPGRWVFLRQGVG